jgi:arabinofuranosyltransferase
VDGFSLGVTSEPDLIAENRALRQRAEHLEQQLALVYTFGRATRSIALAIPVVALLVLGYQQRWTADDAFIDFRVVEQLLAGHGPVYNIGQRVEAFTSPLWLVLLTLFAGLHVPVEVAAVGLGIVLSVGGLALAELGAMRLLRFDSATTTPDTARIVVPLGAIAFVAVPAVWDYVTSGLETGLVFGWIGLAFWLLSWQVTREPTARIARSGWLGVGRGRLATAAVIGLGPLARPDLLLVSLPFLAALAVECCQSPGKTSRPRRLLALAIAAGAVPFLYEIFRAGYFVALEPNTAFAKEAGGIYWAHGGAYWGDFVESYVLWIPLAALSAWWFGTFLKRWEARDWTVLAIWAAPVVGAFLDVLYVLRVGGDFMHGRMLLPGFLCFVLPLAAVAIPVGRGSSRWPGAFAVVVISWSIVCALFLRVPYLGGISTDDISDERGFYVGTAANAHPVTIADHAKDPAAIDGTLIQQRAGKGPPALVIPDDAPPGMKGREVPFSADLSPAINLVVAREAIGLRGYNAGPNVFLFDRHGLTDPISGRFRLERRVARPGHEKDTHYAWIVALFSNPTPALTNPDVAAARAALACGDLLALRHAVQDPLTPARFVANLGLAWRLTSLRIPGSPTDAQRTFCGTG